MIKIGVIVVSTIVLLAGAAEARQSSVPPLDLSIPSAIPSQKSVTVFHSDGGITTGYYNSDQGSLFLSGPRNQITIGNEDAQGNIVIQEYGSDDDD